MKFGRATASRIPPTPPPEPSLSRRSFLTRSGLFASAAVITAGSGAFALPAEADASLADRLRELSDAINVLRARHGKRAIPFSDRLSAVAYTHVMDLQASRVDTRCGGSLHSWSGRRHRGAGGCYDEGDDSTWPIMWDKPREIAGYPEIGFEIAYHSTGPVAPQRAIDAWTRSQAHLDVILSRGVWEDMEWRAIGGFYAGNYACTWFGTARDD